MGSEARVNPPRIKRENLEQIEDMLKKKLNEPVPVPEDLPLKRAVIKWYPVLKGLKDKGYTNKMLSELLSAHGVNISKDRLSIYMGYAVKELERKSHESQGTSPANIMMRKERARNAAIGLRDTSFEMRPDRQL